MKSLIFLTALAVSGYFNPSAISNNYDIPNALHAYKVSFVSEIDSLNENLILNSSIQNNNQCFVEDGISITAFNKISSNSNTVKSNIEKKEISDINQSAAAAGQYITIDQTTYSFNELVTDVLVSNTCADITSFSYFTGVSVGQENGIAYFTADPGVFPFESGVVLTTGSAMDLVGPKTGPVSSGGWAGSTILEDMIPYMNPGDSNDATLIDFNFTTIKNTISFDFLFASDEYGGFQCTYGDALVFKLTNLVTNVESNLALVPGTTDFVSTFTVRDNTYNASCASVNPQYFDSYYGTSGLPLVDDPISLRGYTKPMTASASVIPNVPYTLEIIIADYNDTSYNSAVFLKAKSFDVGGYLGDDITIANGTAQCESTSITLDTELPSNSHSWYFNGVLIPGETGSTLDVTQTGTYSVDITHSGSCVSSDSILIEFIPSPTIQSLTDLSLCDDGTGVALFDFTDNETSAIGTQDPSTVMVSFHTSYSQAELDFAPISNTTSYSGTNGQTIYVRIENISGGCYSIDSFSLNVLNPEINTTSNLEVCDDSSNDGFEAFTLTNQDASILGSLDPTLYSVTYYLDLANANSGTNALSDGYINTTNPQAIFVRVESITDPSCYEVSSTAEFDLVVNAIATATQPNDLQVCDDLMNDGVEAFDLTSQEIDILNGQNSADFTVSFYETQVESTNGVTPISNPTAYVNTASPSQTIYVRVDNNSNPTCFAETTFDIIVNPFPIVDSSPDINVCDSYVLPSLAANNFYYTAIDGPNGSGSIVNEGTVITTSTTLFVYVVTGIAPNECFDQKSFNITINTSPVADAPTDVQACETYTLPSLSPNNFYYTATGGPTGSGTLVAEGTVITTTTTLYVYSENGITPNNCSDENVFTITINPFPVADAPSDVNACDNYTLPTLSTNNNYYTAAGGPNGSGTLVADGTVITTSSVLYVYSEIGTAPNMCSDENLFNITINTSPVADAPTDVQACETYTLPTLSADNFYYTATGGSNGSGTIIAEGTVITTTTTIYVYTENGVAPNDCSDENSFIITINPFPVADAPIDVNACDNYILPALLANNFYYTATGGPNGSGTIVAEGTVISTSSTLYVYTEIGTAPNMCSDENIFNITINVSPVADAPSDVEVCDTYTLPILSPDNFYYTATGGPNGSGTMLPEGSDITSTTTLYVYTENGVAPNDCSDESTFIITINTSPVADAPADVQACDSYILPILSTDNFYYTATGGPSGSGTIVAEGTVINSSTILYVFTENGVSPNICSDENMLTITIDDTPVADAPVDVQACDSYILPNLSPNNFYYTATGGSNGTGLLVPEGTAITTTTTMYVFSETATSPNNCTDENVFNITIDVSPVADAPADVQSCDSYFLPNLSPDNYYYTATGGPNGSGNIVAPGTEITNSTTLYVYTELGSTPNNCTDENSFQVTVNTTPTADAPIDVQVCDTYVLPQLSANNNYYTATGGPSGTGTLLNQGDIITNSTTLFVYSQTGAGPNFCIDENNFDIIINTSPIADNPSDAQSCDMYVLPVLSPNNFYYSQTGGPNGTGVMLAAGDTITISTTLYIYTESGVDPYKCSNENIFNITIDATPVADAPTDVQSCDIYILPQLSVNNTYYTATGGPNGVGNLVAEGTSITTTTTLYVYSDTATSPNNCFDENSFIVTIDYSPVADDPMDVQACDSYILPTLSPNNNYYTETDGPYGTGNMITAGTEIFATTTLYVFSEALTSPNNCKDENSFIVNVNTSPTVNPVDDMIICENDFDNSEAFDLTSNDDIIINNQTDTMVTYHNSLIDAQLGNAAINNPESYQNVSNPETVYIRLENQLTGCYDVGDFDLIVNNSGALLSTTSLTFCDPDSDGFGVFTLTDADPAIIGGAPGIDLSYHETLSDAQLSVNALTSPYYNIVENNQTIYVSINNYNNDCSSVVFLNLIVYPTPQITDPSPLEVCDNDTDGIAVFDLELNNAEILNQLDSDTSNDLAAADYTITFYETLANAEVPQNAIATPNAYVNTTPDLQTIWVRVDDNANGCSTVTTMDLVVNPLPVLVQPDALELCNATDLPGETSALAQEEFTLEDANAQILNGQSGITLTYYFTQSGADTATAADQIFSPYTNVANAQTVYIRAEDNVTNCVSTITLDLRVNPTPSPQATPATLVV
ncbi:choice-of-anchor L domain-containing protein, partial [uncultured Olleya sp.]|uniref:choice-of-anchor L domain-containing protein n=1 Tax=uncultured Olleya sp. TaxID=757243 RepID=UPI0025968AA6